MNTIYLFFLHDGTVKIFYYFTTDKICVALHWIQLYFWRRFSFIKKQYVSKSNMLHSCCSQQQLLINVNIIFMLKNFSLIKIYPSEINNSKNYENNIEPTNTVACLNCLRCMLLDVIVHIRRMLVHIIKNVGDNFKISVTDNMILNYDVTCQFHWDSLFLCSERTRCLISALSDHTAAACAFMGLSLLGSPKRDWIDRRIDRTSYKADHFSFSISRQMFPNWSTLGWNIEVMNLTTGAQNG